MSIDANVAYVECKEDGSGTLHLCDRIPNGSRGQSRLHFETAPHEVTALNGLPIWGGDRSIMLGDIEIAKRIGYTRISFNEREAFLGAVAKHHAAERAARGLASEREVFIDPIKQARNQARESLSVLRRASDTPAAKED